MRRTIRENAKKPAIRPTDFFSLVYANIRQSVPAQLVLSYLLTLLTILVQFTLVSVICGQGPQAMAKLFIFTTIAYASILVLAYAARAILQRLWKWQIEGLFQKLAIVVPLAVPWFYFSLFVLFSTGRVFEFGASIGAAWSVLMWATLLLLLGLPGAYLLRPAFGKAEKGRELLRWIPAFLLACALAAAMGVTSFIALLTACPMD